MVSPDICSAYLGHPQSLTGGNKEIAYALDELKAVGVALSSSYGEGDDASEKSVPSQQHTLTLRLEYIGDDIFDPVWEELNSRSAVVFLHGNQIPSTTPYPHPFLGIPITEVRYHVWVVYAEIEPASSGAQ